MPRISLIATVYQDREGTELFLKRMEEQTRRPDQIVVCDAGSTDGTWELLHEYQRAGPIPLVAMQELRCKPARGRNLAAAAAQHDFLAVTDIGCDWDAEWFEELVAPFDSDPTLDAVMGSWKVRWEDQQTEWAKADFALQNGLEFHATPHSHSANRAIAYRRDFYLRIGGLPEDLTFAADDMVLALLIQRLGKVLAAAPVPRCYWFRPQSLRSLLKEARRNFRGDGEAGIGMKHFVLVGGRLLAEMLILAAFLVSLIARLPETTTFILGLMFGATIASRVWRWMRTARQFARRGFPVSAAHLAALDYLRRWYSLNGYVSGLLSGYRQCRNCRAKLRAAQVGWS